MGIFNFLGSMLGWLLWWFIEFFGNYTIAIFLFTLVVNCAMIPFTIKRLKVAPQQAKFAEKQRELRKFCGRDTKKYNDELMKLYETEGFNPMKGTFSMFVPLILLFCVFSTVSRPLENILHIPKETLKSAFEVVSKDENLKIKSGDRYFELTILRDFDDIKSKMTMFSSEEIEKIDKLKSEFNLFGLNLIGVPKFSDSSTFLWIVPVIAFLFSFVSAVVMQMINSFQTQAGLLIISYIVNPLFFAWTTYIAPAAVGIYWIFNSVLNVLQNLIFSKIYNKFSLSAKEEFERFKTLRLREIEFLKQE